MQTEDLYEEVGNREACAGAVGVTGGFKVGTVFPEMMDSLKDEVWKQSSVTIILADDI